MLLNKAELEDHMYKYFKGSYRAFARALKVEVSQLHRILNSESQAGIVFIGRLHKYCDDNDFKFERFIFFNHSVNCS